MELCCRVNPKAPCKFCKVACCDAHLYKVEQKYITMESDQDKYACIFCFDRRVRGPSLARKRKGMSFKDLFREVRLLLPHGYLSIDVSLDDHRPGESAYSLEWTIYHEKYNHIKGPTPEKALEALRKVLDLPPVEKKETIDI